MRSGHFVAYLCFGTGRSCRHGDGVDDGKVVGVTTEVGGLESALWKQRQGGFSSVPDLFRRRKRGNIPGTQFPSKLLDHGAYMLGIYLIVDRSLFFYRRPDTHQPACRFVALWKTEPLYKIRIANSQLQLV